MRQSYNVNPLSEENDCENGEKYPIPSNGVQRDPIEGPVPGDRIFPTGKGAHGFSPWEFGSNKMHGDGWMDAERSDGCCEIGGCGWRRKGD